MRELSEDFKVFFRTTPEINEVFTTIVSRAKSDPSIRLHVAGQVKGKKANRTNTLNAIVLWLAAQRAADQKRILSEGMRLLGEHLNDEAAPPSSASNGPKVTLHEDMPRARAGKRKSGGGG